MQNLPGLLLCSHHCCQANLSVAKQPSNLIFSPWCFTMISALNHLKNDDFLQSGQEDRVLHDKLANVPVLLFDRVPPPRLCLSAPHQLIPIH